MANSNRFVFIVFSSQSSFSLLHLLGLDVLSLGPCGVIPLAADCLVGPDLYVVGLLRLQLLDDLLRGLRALHRHDLHTGPEVLLKAVADLVAGRLRRLLPPLHRHHLLAPDRLVE